MDQCAEAALPSLETDNPSRRISVAYALRLPLWAGCDRNIRQEMNIVNFVGISAPHLSFDELDVSGCSLNTTITYRHRLDTCVAVNKREFVFWYRSGVGLSLMIRCQARLLFPNSSGTIVHDSLFENIGQLASFAPKPGVSRRCIYPSDKINGNYRE